MTSGWIGRARVSRQLSKTGQDEILYSDFERLTEYVTKVCNFMNECSIDRRAIAVGGDIEHVRYQAFLNMDADLKAISWHSISMMKMWYDVVLGNGSVDSPSKVLTVMQLPSSFYLDYLQDRTIEFTFVNNNDLFFFEQFFLDEQILSEYPNIRYSAADVQDIVAGVCDSSFDIVRVGGYSINKHSSDILDAYMNCTKVGGLFVLHDSADFGDMYTNTNKFFTSMNWDFNKHIAGRDDFISYHIPYDVGLTVAKRVS